MTFTPQSLATLEAPTPSLYDFQKKWSSTTKLLSSQGSQSKFRMETFLRKKSIAFT